MMSNNARLQHTLLGALLGWLLLVPLASAELKQWRSDSLAGVEQRYQGQSFIVALWSLECPPCYKEMAMLSRWQRQHPDSKLVLVSTDSEAAADELIDTVARFDFLQAEQWVFAPGDPQRLRYGIDKHWRGELPRSYLYKAGHYRKAVSGLLDADDLSWQ